MSVLLPGSMLNEVIVSLVSFLVLFAVLAKFAFPPITNMLEKRAETIKESLEKAEETRIEAERLLDEYKAQMAEARLESGRIIEQGRKVAEGIKDEMLAKATEESAAVLAKAREEIASEKRAAISELQASVADISVQVAGKLIGATLKREDHEKLIAQFMDEVGALNGN